MWIFSLCTDDSRYVFWHKFCDQVQAWTAELWKLRNDFANLKMSGIKKKGLVGYQPSRDKYKCSVDNYKAENIRGDDIRKHFQSKVYLWALC